MTTRMLIDARHREETRVAVVKGNRIEEFDFESAEHKQLKGNIYLAKVTRVEPSLQAAFVEYGGNRHGFLAFSEIHPDYYQIPKEDRDALLREEAEHAAADAAMRAEEDLESLEGEIEDVQPPAPLDDDGHYADDDQDGDDSNDDGENGDGERSDRGRSRGRRRPRASGRDRDERDDAADQRQSLRRRYKIQDVIRRRQVLLVQVVKEERGNKGAALTSYLSLAGRYCVLMPNSSNGGGISRKISNGADRKRLKTIIDELGLPMTMGCIVRTAGLERTKTEIKRDFDYLARLWDEIRDKTLKSEAPALIHSDSDLIKRAIRDIYHREIEEVLVEGEDGYRAAKDFMKLLMPSHAKRVQQYADPVSLFQRYGAEDQLGAMYQPLVQLKSGGYLVINPTEALVSIDINSGRSTREHNIEQTALNTNLEAAYEIARQLRLRDMAGLVVIDFIDMDMSGNVRKVERAMRDALKNDRARIQVGRISGFGLMEMSRQRLRTGVLEASTRACPHCEGTGLVRTASSAGLSALRLLEEEAARGRGTRLTLRASQEAAFYVLNNKRLELGEIEARYGVTIEVQSDGQTEGARMAVDVSGPPPANRPSFAPIADLDDEPEDNLSQYDDEDEDDGEPIRARRDGGGESRRDERSDDGGDGKRKRRGRRRRGGRRDEGGADDGRAPAQDQTRDDDSADRDGGDGERSDTDRSDAPRDDADGDATRKRRRGRRGGRNRRPAGAEGDARPERGSEADGDDQGRDGNDRAPATGGTGFYGDGPAVVAEIPADPAPTADAVPEKAPARRRKRKVADVLDDSAPAAETSAVAVVVADDTAPTPAKRTRRKATVTATATVDSDAAVPPTAEAAPATDADPAPAETAAKPKRAPRARKASAAVATADAAAADAPAASVDADTGDDAARPAADVTADGDASDGGERRRGWWQRTFGA